VSTSVTTLPKPRTAFHAPPVRRSIILYDLTAPNVVRPAQTPRDALAENRGSMHVLEALARRVNMRMEVEISARHCGRSSYKRLRCASILCSAPNAEQAELFIQAIHDFAATLNGKWLAAKPPDSPTPGPKPGGSGE
jgi:hypothetical protein